MCSLRYKGFSGAAEVGITESRKIDLSCHEIGKLVLEMSFKRNECGYFSIGLAWLGLAWLGLAWLGLAWLGLACRSFE
jgi:hypothetical protein